MDELQIQEKRNSMKKTRKTLGTLSLIAALVAIVLLIVYNFLGVTFMKVTTPDTIISAANFTQGFTFPGWQMVFWGCGGQFIMQDNLFNPNPLAIIALVGTLLVLIICQATYKAGKIQAKAVKEFIAGGCLVFSALVLGFLIAQVAKLAVTSGGVYNFSSYVNAEGTIFAPTTIAILVGVVLLVCAAVKIYNGIFLLKVRDFNKQYPPKKAA